MTLSEKYFSPLAISGDVALDSSGISMSALIEAFQLLVREVLRPASLACFGYEVGIYPIMPCDFGNSRVLEGIFVDMPCGMGDNAIWQKSHLGCRDGKRRRAVKIYGWTRDCWCTEVGF
jgi:hypothetical protein